MRPARPRAFAGARVAHPPADVGAACDIVGACGQAAQTEAVLFGEQRARHDSGRITFVLCPTVDPNWSWRGTALERHGLHYIDARLRLRGQVPERQMT